MRVERLTLLIGSMGFKICHKEIIDVDSTGIERQ